MKRLEVNDDILLSDVQSKVAGHYYNMFFSFFQRMIKKYCRIPYVNMNNTVVDDIYSSIINAYFKSVTMFKYISGSGKKKVERTVEDLWNGLQSTDDFPEIKTKELERKFINYLYNNIKFYIWNYFTKKNKQNATFHIVDIDYHEDIQEEDRFTLAENYVDINNQIDKFANDELVQNKLSLQSNQIKYLLSTFFTKENYRFYKKTDLLSSHVITPIIESIYEENKNSRDGIKRKNSYRSFKMKFYELLENFIYSTQINN